jgi:hypothetical protein
MSTLAAPTRTGPARLAIGYCAIACAVPYLALKIIWLTGGQLGVADPAMMRDPSMVALNTLTALMDLVAIAIALAFTHRWGLRIPAWLVLPPMWVASGLLIRFVAGVPTAAIVQMFASEPVRAPLKGPVHPWVYLVVYTEFVGMGIGLMLAFVLYAQTRWSTVFGSHIPAVRSGATHVVQAPLANVAALMAAAVAGLHLDWAFGGTIGLGTRLVARRTLSSYPLNALEAIVAIAAAIGIVAIVHGPGRWIPFWLALTLAWIGGGSLFAWGLWHLINVLGDTALIRENAADMALLNLVSLLRLVAGLIIGVLTLFVVAEWHSAGSTA